jgi:hypothetical protein
MIDIKVPKITIEIDTPTDPTFWRGVGLETAKGIRKRTETQKVDADEQVFKPYSQVYKEYRRKKGRTTTPNLSFSGRMLGAIAAGVRATRHGVSIIMSGEEGAKAYENERRGREFFAISDRQVNSIRKLMQAWMEKKNRMK